MLSDNLFIVFKTAHFYVTDLVTEIILLDFRE